VEGGRLPAGDHTVHADQTPPKCEVLADLEANGEPYDLTQACGDLRTIAADPRQEDLVTKLQSPGGLRGGDHSRTELVLLIERAYVWHTHSVHAYE